MPLWNYNELENGINAAEINKLNGMISNEERCITNCYAEVGRKYFELHKDSCEPDYEKIFYCIKESQATIEAYTKQIKQLKGIIECPVCNADNPYGSRFCSSCSSKIVLNNASSFCTNCGSVLNPDSAFCTNCGAKATKDAPVTETPIIPETSPVVQPVENTNICTNCGAPILPDTVFCTKCGYKVEKIAPAIDVPVTPIAPVVPEAPVAPAVYEMPAVPEAPAVVEPVNTANICKSCGVELESDAAFCTNCGAKVESNVAEAPSTTAVNVCPKCGNIIVEDAVFCIECGYKLG